MAIVIKLLTRRKRCYNFQDTDGRFKKCVQSNVDYEGAAILWVLIGTVVKGEFDEMGMPALD